MFQFGKYNVDIIEMLSGHQAHQFKGLGLDRQLQHQQQVQLHQHQIQQQQQGETSGAILSGLGLGPLQGSRSSAFSDSASIFAKMSAPPPPLQQQSLSSSSQSLRKSSKMSGSSSSSGSHVSGYPQFLRSFHPTEAALAQEQLHSVGRFDHFASSSGSGGTAGGIGGLVSSVPPPPPLHPCLSVPHASPGAPSSSSSPVSTSNNPPSSSTVTTLGHQLAGSQSDARSLHQQFSCMLAANQYFLSGVPANSSLEQFLVQQGSHNHLSIGLGQAAGETSSALAPPPALHSSHTHGHSTTLSQPQQPPPQQQQLPPHTLSHPHPHHPLHSSQPSSLGSFDFQGIPVLSSNQLASLMQQEAGLPLPLPLHLSLSKEEGKGDSATGGGASGGRRKKAMAGYLPQRKPESSSTSSTNPNTHSSTSGGHNQDNTPGLDGSESVDLSGIGGDPPSHLTSSSSVALSSSSASCTSAPVLVTNGSKTDNHGSMPPQSQPEQRALYHCGECGKTFTHLSSLRRHLRSHELTTAGTSGTRSNIVNPVLHPADPSIPHSTQDDSATSSCASPDKTFQCSECGKGFKKKGHLLQHGVIHSGARPYSCTTCSRAFNRRESLTRHEKIHEEKPFRCPACGRCFRESTSLLNHAASGTCGKSGRAPRSKHESNIVECKSNKSGGPHDGIATNAVGSYRSDDFSDDYKDQRSQGNMYSETSSCGGGSMTGPALRKAPLAPTLHPHLQSQNQQQHHHQQPHLPLSSLLDDSEDDVTSSVNNAISAITAAAANCMSGDLTHSGGRGDDRRDIIGGLLGGLGLGPLGSPSGPSSTSGIDKSYRGSANQSAVALNQQPNQQPGGKPKRPRKPRKKKEPGVVCFEATKRRQSSHRPVGPSGDVRPYLCSVCGRGFARRETLRRHDRIHTGEKSHHCSVCGKYFREAFHLSKHHTVHSGEKNFKCILCGKDFGYAQSLKRHGKLHQKGELEEVPTTPSGGNLNCYPSSGGSLIQGGQGSSTSFYSYTQDIKPQTSNPQPPPRLYTCAICWKSFRHHFHLTAHHQTVHEGGGEKLFSCEVCGKAFAYSNSLTRHRLSQHGLTRTGQVVAQRSTSEDNSVGGSISESEAATNALLQLAPPSGTHGEQQSHVGVLHTQEPPPQPQAGYSSLFYVPDSNALHPSSSNASTYSHSLSSSSSVPLLCNHQHQHAGVKGEPIYQTGHGHTFNPNVPVHSLALPPLQPHQQHHNSQQHLNEIQSTHHQTFQSQEELRRRKKKKKRLEERGEIGYNWMPARVEREHVELSLGERQKNESGKLLRRSRAIRRRQHKIKKHMAVLVRIRQGSAMYELGLPGGLKLNRLRSLKVPLKRRSCPLCLGATFSQQAALKVHIAARHCPRVSGLQQRLRCPVCGKQSHKFLSALIHRSSHLANRAFSCKHCACRFWNAMLLTRHKKVCRGTLASFRRERALCVKLVMGSTYRKFECKGNSSALPMEYNQSLS
ncbi:zinc finger protein 865-like [Xyrauchen texanus]|uniref:zinc finger protein 865-like n=1 Tax=Xyrauchen texanus TaxID=154827 RepID=UPI002241EAA7|nr:zinc finger protein 865-like [Xyrauchen texanus]